ncbi:methyltransferase [Oceanibaculum sp.]|uniref:methyltransferase n=1 Tax=Oceanibaculum sp. TaxID=1903597 RepID=UPI00258D0EA7|nr:methyltransferase [Oceanibaculum sp.]MCH2394810.1 methyltransferase [Oceanibaculum sp.]
MAGGAGIAEPARETQPAPPPSLAIRLRHWRNRQIGSPGFRRLMARLPVTRWIASRKANHLFRLTAGFVHSQILGSCVRLGLFGLLEGGGQTTGALVQACGLAPARLRLLLEQAERLALVREMAPDFWMLDDAGAVIAGDAGLAAMIRHHDIFYRDIGDLDGLLRGVAGDTELARFWAYARGEGAAGLDAAAVAPYSSLMRLSQAMIADCVLGAHDFSRYRCLLDVGGGDGAFLAEAGRAHPALELRLFDLPAVAERAQQHLADLGLAGRSRVQGGDFVQDRLPDEADCVTLIRILCDHDDDRTRRILGNLHRSLKPGTHLVVAEAMAGPSEGARLAASYFSLYFLAMGSGRCRGTGDIMALLTEAGFQAPRIVQTANPLLATLIVARR